MTRSWAGSVPAYNMAHSLYILSVNGFRTRDVGLVEMSPRCPLALIRCARFDVSWSLWTAA